MAMGLLALPLALAAGAVDAAAQLPPPSPFAAATAFASPATVRGYAAVAANPAALGAPNGPTRSATAFSLALRNGLDPVGLGDLADWEGRDVPRRVRVGWLEEVLTRGSQAGAAGLDVTVAAVSWGSLGVQFSTRAQGRMSLNADAAELLLFGNAGLTGEPRDFDLASSRGVGWVVSTAALGYGRRVGSVRGGDLRLGATATWSVGHALGLGHDNGSGLGGDPTELDLRFPVLHVDSRVGGLDHGHGGGLDLGAFWTDGRLTLGATVRNVVNTFEWTLEDLSFRPGAALFDPDESSTDFDERPAEEAPPVLQDALAALTYPAALILGAAWRHRPDMLVTADLGVEEHGGMGAGPDLHVGVGAEYRPRDHVPLRAGLGMVERGVELSAGAGVELGGFTVAGGLGYRTGALDDLLTGTLGASWASF